jgi:hypothetical protein
MRIPGPRCELREAEAERVEEAIEYFTKVGEDDLDPTLARQP